MNQQPSSRRLKTNNGKCLGTIKYTFGGNYNEIHPTVNCRKAGVIGIYLEITAPTISAAVTVAAITAIGRIVHQNVCIITATDYTYWRCCIRVMAMIACIYDTIVIPVHVGRVTRMVVDKTNVIIYRVWNLREKREISPVFSILAHAPRTHHIHTNK